MSLTYHFQFKGWNLTLNDRSNNSLNYIHDTMMKLLSNHNSTSHNYHLDTHLLSCFMFVGYKTTSVSASLFNKLFSFLKYMW